MIEAVSQFDPKTAAGILSRLALKLDVPEPSREAIGRLEDLERRVLTELRQTLRIAQNDNSRSAMEQLANALDQQAAQAAGIEPDESTAENLNRAGLLPSDAFEVGFQPYLAARYEAHWENSEESLAQTTVRYPHREQNFGPSLTGDPETVSIFGRFFTHKKYQARSFWMLAGGLRARLMFSVALVYRLYPQDVDLSKSESLTDALHAFVNKFCVDIDLNGQRGRFFQSVTKRDFTSIRDHIVWPSLKKGEKVDVHGLGQAISDEATVKLVFAVNFSEYLRSVERRHGFDRDVISQVR